MMYSAKPSFVFASTRTKAIAKIHAIGSIFFMPSNAMSIKSFMFNFFVTEYKTIAAMSAPTIPFKTSMPVMIVTAIKTATGMIKNHTGEDAPLSSACEISVSETIPFSAFASCFFIGPMSGMIRNATSSETVIAIIG